MSDLERRLSESLEAVAGGAPSADGLAAAARRRRRARSRARLVTVAVVAIAAVVLVPVAVSSVRGGARDSTALDHGGSIVATTDDGWQTVEQGGVLVDVPPDWVRLDTGGCEFHLERYGPPDLDPCSNDAGLWFFAGATFDPATYAGIRRLDDPPRDSAGGDWSGYVYGGDLAVDVAAVSRAVAWRILSSVRTEDDPLAAGDPSLSPGLAWHRGRHLQVPGSWEHDGELTWCPGPCGATEYRLVFHDARPPRDAYGDVLEDDEGRWVGSVRLGPDLYATVVAPTQAIGDLVLGSGLQQDS